MGTRGPKPLPANVHMLRGNPSKKPIASLLDDVVRPDVSIPDPPEFLGPEAVAEWNRITGHLAKLGLVTELDRAVLTAYCTAWADLDWVERQIAAAAASDPTGQDGRITKREGAAPRIGALVKMKYEVLASLDRFAAEFGMSPSARSRVTPSDPQLDLPGIEDKPEESGWGAFS
ncbi:MAG: phage terminase small subunit P27 family [Betaproteobacteria bacterium]|nr:phage terminase small subunit P27 family [Betaproteobacteria bacterium]